MSASLASASRFPRARGWNSGSPRPDKAIETVARAATAWLQPPGSLRSLCRICEGSSPICQSSVPQACAIISFGQGWRRRRHQIGSSPPAAKNKPFNCNPVIATVVPASGIFPRPGKMLYRGFKTFSLEPCHATSACERHSTQKCAANGTLCSRPGASQTRGARNPCRMPARVRPRPKSPFSMRPMARASRNCCRSAIQRMLQSLFTFLRGAAAVMAHDLATLPRLGIHVQACGDCHLMNFGRFQHAGRTHALRHQRFRRDFARRRFPVDLKRLAASVAVAALNANMPDKKAQRSCRKLR